MLIATAANQSEPAIEERLAAIASRIATTLER